VNPQRRDSLPPPSRFDRWEASGQREGSFNERNPMKYVIEFWNPWKGCWQRWNMKPVSETSACVLMIAREQFDGSLHRRVVEATN